MAAHLLTAWQTRVVRGADRDGLVAITFGTLALLLVGVAGWLGSTWVDIGDSTCGAVYRPDLWWDRSACEGRMIGRTIATAGIVALAVGLFAFGVRGGRSSRQS